MNDQDLRLNTVSLTFLNEFPSLYTHTPLSHGSSFLGKSGTNYKPIWTLASHSAVLAMSFNVSRSIILSTFRYAPI